MDVFHVRMLPLRYYKYPFDFKTKSGTYRSLAWSQLTENLIENLDELTHISIPRKYVKFIAI